MMSHIPPQPATTAWQFEQLFSLIALSLTFYFNRRGGGGGGADKKDESVQDKTKSDHSFLHQYSVLVQSDDGTAKCHF